MKVHSFNIQFSGICPFNLTFHFQDSFMLLCIMIVDFQYHIAFYCVNISQFIFILVHSWVVSRLLNNYKHCCYKNFYVHLLVTNASIFLGHISRSRVVGLQSMQIFTVVRYLISNSFLLFPTFYKNSSVQCSRSVMSDSLLLQGLWHTRPPYPSPAPGVYPNSCPLSW